MGNGFDIRLETLVNPSAPAPDAVAAGLGAGIPADVAGRGTFFWKPLAAR
jgi:hypothetical protein